MPRFADDGTAGACTAGSCTRIACSKSLDSGRLDLELVDQGGPRVAVGLECIGLAAASIEREHQLTVQTLGPRMFAREPLELADKLGMPPGS